MAYEELGFLPDPTQNAGGIGHTMGDKRQMTTAQRLQTLVAQRDDPARDPESTPELEREIARLKMIPADDLGFQPDAAAPQASQADVRKAEPRPSPIQSQREKEARFADAAKRYVQATGGVIAPGKNFRQMVEEWSSIQDPVKTVDQAEIEEVRAGGDVQYGDSVPYVASKTAASIGGFAAGGPAGATGAEALVRFTALAHNLKKAVDAGAITQDRAAELMAKEMAKGTGEDALFNFGLPLLGQAIAKVPGVQWLGDKVAALLKVKGPTQELVEQRGRKISQLADSAETPAAKTAVEEIGRRTQDVVPTPGQVTGSASMPEIAARISGPQKFKEQGEQISQAVAGMREDLVNPTVQPSAKGLGERIVESAEAVQKAVKTRLRPTFQEADNLGVRVDLDPVLARAKAALAADASVPGGKLAPKERADLEALIAQLDGTSQHGLASNSQVSAEAALDFMSRQKEKLRAVTADWKPSKFYETIMNGLAKDANAAYTAAAQRAGRPDIVQKLTAAQNDYREMMETVYDDAVKQALRKNPEDVGRLFWTSGNVSEIEQLQKMLGIAMREGTMGRGEVAKLSRDMTRGFLQEAVRDLQGAAKWSDTLKADPLKRRTWETLTAAPGGSQLRGAMEVLEQAAKIAQRSSPELIGQIGMGAIPIRRAAGLGLGVSYVTGAVHPGMLVAGLSLDALTRLMATAYTQGNKGVLNTIMRALRANSAGTAAGAKALQEALPEIEKFAAENDITDIFVGQQEQ